MIYTGQVNRFLLLKKSDRIEEDSKSTGGKLIVFLLQTKSDRILEDLKSTGGKFFSQ